MKTEQLLVAVDTAPARDLQQPTVTKHISTKSIQLLLAL